MGEKKSPKSRPAVKRERKLGSGTPGVPERRPPAPVVERAEPLPPAEVSLNVEALMAQAIERQVPIEYMRELVALFDGIRAKVAEREFNEDLAAAQAEFPVIEKTAQARDHTSCQTCKNTGFAGDGSPCPDGKLLYVYAPKGDLVAKIGPIITKHGFSATATAEPFKHPEIGEPFMRGTCVVRHRGGHSETTVVSIPIGKGTRIMSPMQLYMGAASFAQRYAYKMAFGIAERGDDVDYTEEPPAEPQAVPGAKTDDLGRRVEERPPEKSIEIGSEEKQTVVANDLPSARAELQRCLNEMGQVYSAAWKPIFDANRSIILSETEAKRLYPKEGPFNRLFSEAELEAYKRDGKTAWNDADALEGKRIEWRAALADRKVDLGARKGR